MLRRFFVNSSESAPVVAFGDGVFDRDARRLRRGDRPVLLSPKAFALLSALLEARPRALSKGELHDRLWPGTYVTHTSLPRVVAEVRKAIGDRRRGARFLSTLHGFGYAFCGEVRVSPSQPGMVSTAGVRCGIVWRAHEIDLPDGETLIGRGRDCALRIDVPEISRHHARIRIAGDQATIEDLGSRNGTSVNGNPVSRPASLADGAEIVLGSEILLFRVAGATRSTKTGRLKR